MHEFLGLNVGGHDSSATSISIIDRKPASVLILLSERLSKLKHQGHFPFHSLRQLIKERPMAWGKINNQNVAINSFSKHPFDLEMNFTANEWEVIKLFQLEKTTKRFNPDISFITHHLCHAYSTLLQCPFSKALIIVSDGAGSRISHFPEDHPERLLLNESEDQTEFMTVYQMDEGIITPLKKEFMIYESTANDEIKSSASLGSFFEMVSRLIFGDWAHAGKVMGLAAYGNVSKIKNQKEFILEMATKPFTQFKNKQDFDSQPPEEFQKKADLAASVQAYFEERMIETLKRLRKENSEYENIILVGGCALNCLLNSRILKENIFQKVFVPPFPNDEGISVGAALALAYSQKKIDFQTVTFDEMNPYLGALIHDTKLEQNKVPQIFQDYLVTKPENLSSEVAAILASGEIVAWMQGRSEVGPRALGNRSILARPDAPGIKEKLNETVKFREKFRPYGATILHHRTVDYFKVGAFYESPFMTFCPEMKDSLIKKFQGIVHIDGTCRIQTLHRNQNPVFFSLLEEFEKLTGIPILLNTSLNIMNQPILESIDDALVFFRSSAIKYLIYGDYLISKSHIDHP